MTIPGHGDDRINAAYTLGGPALAIKTVQDLTGMPINHVVLVDFSGFRELVDALGGVTIDNPTKIISNSFDGHPWRFGRGRLHLDGRHALAYARVRENTANPPTTTSRAGLRQQRVLQAIAHGLASPGTLLHLPSVGSALGKPLTTDLSANDLLAARLAADARERTIHCRLGGTITSIGGASELIGGDENRRVILAVLGKSAPLARRARRHVRRRLHLRPRRAWVRRRAWSCRASWTTSSRRPSSWSRSSWSPSSSTPTCEPESELVRLGAPTAAALLRAGLRRRARVGPVAVGALAAPAVVGRVEALALVVHRRGVQHALHGLPADLAHRHGLVGEALHDVEAVPVRAEVLVDRHSALSISRAPPGQLALS